MAAFPLPPSILTCLLLPPPSPPQITINGLPLNTTSLQLIVNIPPVSIVAVDGEVTLVNLNLMPPVVTLETEIDRNTRITTVKPANPTDAAQLEG